MVVAIVALIVALGGSAVAASVLITSPSQIRDNVITGAKLRSQAITSRELKRGAVGTAQLSGGAVNSTQIRAGAITSSKLSPDTRAALQSIGTTAQEFIRKAGPENVTGGESRRVATAANMPAGVYAIFAKTIITDLSPPSSLLTPGNVSNAHCVLSAGGDTDDSRALVRTPFGGSPATVSMQITHTFDGSGGDITITCDNKTEWRASDTSIIAIRLGRSPRTAVNG
jgi:hypothetical protein